jgi:hypothetical protein
MMTSFFTDSDAAGRRGLCVSRGASWWCRTCSWRASARTTRRSECCPLTRLTGDAREIRARREERRTWSLLGGRGSGTSAEVGAGSWSDLEARIWSRDPFLPQWLACSLCCCRCEACLHGKIKCGWVQCHLVYRRCNWVSARLYVSRWTSVIYAYNCTVLGPFVRNLHKSNGYVFWDMDMLLDLCRHKPRCIYFKYFSYVNWMWLLPLH